MHLIITLFWLGLILVAAFMVFELVLTLVLGVVVTIGTGFVWLFRKIWR